MPAAMRYDIEQPRPVVLADSNYAEMCRVISRNAGGRLFEVDGLLMWAGAHPSPAIVNGVIRTRGSEPRAAQMLELATKWFGEIGHGFALHVRVGRDDDLEHAAQDRGFRELVDLPVMVYEGEAPEVIVPEGHVLERVEDEQGIRDLVEAVAGPFELPGEMASVFARPESVLSPFTAAVVVRDADGTPVGGAWTSVSYFVAGIGFVGTAEASRGRGVGTAATAAAMRLGYAMGGRAAALQASPMGRSVYARMGFREVGAYRLLADEASMAKMHDAN
jgi:hypothetical protein